MKAVRVATATAAVLAALAFAPAAASAAPATDPGASQKVASQKAPAASVQGYRAESSRAGADVAGGATAQSCTFSYFRVKFDYLGAYAPTAAGWVHVGNYRYGHTLEAWNGSSGDGWTDLTNGLIVRADGLDYLSCV